MSHPVSRAGGTYSRTSSEDYGAYNNDWQRTYITSLPKVLKNKELQRTQGSFRTGNEEYGQYWSSHGRNSIPQSAVQSSYEPIQEPRTVPIEAFNPVSMANTQGGNKMEMIDGSERGRSIEQKRKPKQNLERRRRPTVSRRQTGTLPDISQNKSSTKKPTSKETPRFGENSLHGRGIPSTRRVASRSTGNAKPRNVYNSGTSGLKLKSTPVNDMRLPEIDIDRIDLNLHTKDGRVVTLTAVPIFVSSYRK